MRAKRLLQNWPLLVAGGFAGTFFPLRAFAQLGLPSTAIPNANFDPLCNSTELCWNSPATGFASLFTFLDQIAIPSIRTVFIGVATAYFAFYALKFIFSAGEESEMTEGRKAFGHAAIGMAIAGIASAFVATFAPSSAWGNLVLSANFVIAINTIVDYLSMITGIFLVFVVSMAGFRIIVLQGNESEIEKQRKNFFGGLLGVVLLLLVRVGVNAIVPAGSAPGGATSPIPLIKEAAGMVKFLLGVIAGLAILSLVAGGIFFIVSLGNDERRQRARRILVSTIVVLIIVVLSHTLVATFIR